MEKVAIIGAGPLGLTCAYHLSKKGFGVEIFERDDRIGGLSASFDFDGLLLERYYHFICGDDQHTFRLLRELGIFNTLHWSATKMGFYHNGQLYKWGDPLSLLTFPKLNLLSKIRYGLHIMHARNIKNWKKLDTVEASEWIKGWIGEGAYDMLWKCLFEKKFFEYASYLSAAWVGTRIRRVGNSRKNIFFEQMGYLEGGTQTLLNRLREEIESHDGLIHINSPAEKVVIEGARVKFVKVNGKERKFDKVICTVPLPYLSGLIADLPRPYLKEVQSIFNIGVVCTIVKLKRSLTENFWMNISDPGIDIPGLIEYSNLRTLKEKILYAPYYMPPTHPKWKEPREFFIKEVIGYLPRINADFRKDWVLGAETFRYEYAQPVFTPFFFQRVPPYETGVNGLYAADTTHSYPEDRSINESIRIAEEICALIS